VLIDARHGIKPVDEAVLETLGTAAVSYQVVLTKADELKPGELDKRMADTLTKIEKRAAAYPEILPTSSRTGFGIPELRAGIAKLLSERGAG
jgi:GTP-binding protein